MFAEMGTDAATLDAMSETYAVWLPPRLEDGRYFGFLAEDAGVVVAGVGLLLMDWPPGPLHPRHDKRGFVLDVFVESAYRGHGLATELMKRAEEELLGRGVMYAALQASKMGRPVYERLGWGATNEMGKALG